MNRRLRSRRPDNGSSPPRLQRWASEPPATAILSPLSLSLSILLLVVLLQLLDGFVEFLRKRGLRSNEEVQLRQEIKQHLKEAGKLTMAMMGSGGVSDGYEGTKRPRMIESNPYFAVSGGGASDGYDAGSKRPRTMEPNPYFSGIGASSFYQPYSGNFGGGSSGIYNFPLVRLRGLPFNCDDLDVYKFFAGLDIVDCLLVNKNGRFSGEAFVVFPSPMQAEFALQRDRQNMGRRYIEVFRCKKQDYYNAIAAEVNYGGAFDSEYRQSSPPARPKRSFEDKDQMEYTEVLKLRGLPYSATQADIVDFFVEFELTEDKVHIACRPDGKATGEAFAEFPSAEVAKKAMCKDKMTIGSRYVELFPSTPDEARRAKSRFRQ